MFLVVVHDVTTGFRSPVTHMLQALDPLVGTNVAAAVVPRWHGQSGVDANLSALIETRCGEVLLHGCTHRTACWWHPLALLTNRANEFSRLPLPIALIRIRVGRALLQRWFDAPITGFVPPAWQMGPLTPAALAQCGLHYGLCWSSRVMGTGQRQPLATWSWDAGRVAVAGLLGEWAGAARVWLTRSAIPCVVLHPADVARGYLARALALVRWLLASGRKPVLPGQLAAGDTHEIPA